MPLIKIGLKGELWSYRIELEYRKVRLKNGKISINFDPAWPLDVFIDVTGNPNVPWQLDISGTKKVELKGRILHHNRDRKVIQIKKEDLF